MKRQWRGALILGCLILGSVGLGGCWDSTPINHEGIVLGIGINPGSQPHQYQWHFVFPNVTLTPSSLSSVQQDTEYYEVTVQAPTFATAVVRAQQASLRTLYLGQLQVVIWSPRLALRQWQPILAAINAIGAIPKTFWVMTTQTPSVTHILTANSPQVAAPRFALSAFFDCTRCQPIDLATRGWRAWAASVSPGITPAVPVVARTAMGISVRSLAVYSEKGPAVVWPPTATEGYGYLMGRVNRLALALPWQDGMVSISRLVARATHSVTLTRTGLAVRVRIHVTGWVDPMAGPTTSINLAQEHAIRQAAEHAILRQCLQAVALANRTHTDPFGYGRAIGWQHPSAATMPLHVTITVAMVLKGEGEIQ